MAEQQNNDPDPLAEANLGSDLFLSDFPAKIRVLTRDPMVYGDKYGNTRYAFAVFNLETKQVQILNKGPGFAKRFKEINADKDFGGDIRLVDLKITTNGKPGIEVRYTITPVGAPSQPTKEQIATIVEQGFDLGEKIKKNNPNALRLSEVNAGKKVIMPESDEVEPEKAGDDVVIEDIGDEKIDLDKIPF